MRTLGGFIGVYLPNEDTLRSSVGDIAQDAKDVHVQHSQC
jgi:hypothetical protein